MRVCIKLIGTVGTVIQVQNYLFCFLSFQWRVPSVADPDPFSGVGSCIRIQYRILVNVNPDRIPYEQKELKIFVTIGYFL